MSAVRKAGAYAQLKPTGISESVILARRGAFFCCLTMLIADFDRLITKGGVG